VVVLHLLDFDTGLANTDATFQAGIATAAVAGEHLDAIERRHDAALHAADIQRFIALQGAVHLHQHLLQRRQRKAGQAIAQHIVVKATWGSDPLLEGRLRQFRFELLETGQAEDEAVKDREENRRGGDLGVVPGIGESGGSSAESEYLVQISGKGGEFVCRPVLPFHKCKTAGLPELPLPSTAIAYSFALRLRCRTRWRRSNSRLISEIFSS